MSALRPFAGGRATLAGLVVAAAVSVSASPGAAQVRHRRPFAEGYRLNFGFDGNGGAPGCRDYNCGVACYDGHDGSDFGTPFGTNIVASQSGRVTQAVNGCADYGHVGNTCGGLCGNYVQLEHSDGSRTIYCHLRLNSIRVRVGETVSCGQLLGQSASSGSSSGPHLHYGYRRSSGSASRDPYRGSCATAESIWISQGGYRDPPGTSCGCTARCDGSVLRSADCSSGDCAAFGARCVSDSLGPRCVFAQCPDVGEASICWGGSRIGQCRNGALVSQGDCAAYGATCQTVSGAARCVFAGCPASGTRRACLDEQRIMTCREGVPDDVGDCGAFGGRCVDDALGARCVFVFCPPRGEAHVCWDETRIGHCRDGELVSQGDCAAFAAFCSTAGDRPARCVSAFCAPDRDTPPRASRSCWFEAGKIAVCDSEGGFRLEDCPAGQQCSVTGGVECVPAVCPTGSGGADAMVCLDEHRLGRCSGGSVIGVDDCRPQGGRCVQHPEGARCVALDAGSPPDGGMSAPDASAALDAGGDGGADAGPGRRSATGVGCGCSIPGGSLGLPLWGRMGALGLVVLGALRRRRVGGLRRGRP